MIVRAKNNQSWLDLSLQYLGSADLAYECALLNMNVLINLDPSANPVTISDAPPINIDLTLPDTIIDQKVVDYYRNNNIFPASKYQGNNLGGFLLQANGGYILQAGGGTPYKIQID